MPTSIAASLVQSGAIISCAEGWVQTWAGGIGRRHFMLIAMSQTPVSVITGFLGSGKTTLLRALLARPEMGDTAVVINEFGEVGLDHMLIESSDETVVELASGCVCCTIRGDLAATLVDLLARRRAGLVPEFRRIVVETTGLAEPGPILQVVMNDPLLAEELRLDRVTTTVDAVNGAATLDAHPEAVKQAALADRLVLTKTDLLRRPPERLIERLRALNPAAGIEFSNAADFDSSALFGGGAPAERLVAWLAAHGGHEHHGHSHHADDIASVAIVRDEAIPGVALALFLELLAEHCGARLLRLKGIVKLAEAPERPAVIHGVQHVFHPPVWLDAWPDGDERTRIVLIAKGVPGAWLETLLDVLCEEVSGLKAA
jgi:G3E family GTPase